MNLARTYGLGAVLIASCWGCTAATSSPTAPTSDETTFIYSTTLTPNGAASRSFATGDTGIIAVTLTEVTPPSPLGIGVGIPRVDGGGCQLTQSIDATVGTAPSLSITAEGAATYCLKVFDSGHVIDKATFFVTVTHP